MNKPINTIFAHPKNPRLIRNEKYLEQKKSIEETPEMMDLRPVLIDENNIILGGHQRWRACKELGWKDVPVMQYTREKHLKSESFTKFNKTYELVCAEIVIKDNTHYGEFDYDILANEWDYLPLTEYGVAVWETEPEEVDGLTDEDAVPEAPSEPITKLGDVWILGEHRVMCGDSTSKEAVDILMDGEKADMVFTDPPYGVSYNGGHNEKKRKGIKNDTLDGVDLSNLFQDSINIACVFSKDTSPFYIWYAGGKSVETFAGLSNTPIQVRAIICWYKIKSGLGAFMSQYIPNYEPCIYGFKEGKSIQWFGDTDEKTVWEFKRDNRNDYHPTQKPIDVVTRALNNSSKLHDVVYDAFLGSGSTLIAAEKTKRKCYGMELDPKYCDVIVKRWEDFTGKKAHLEENEFEVITQAN